MKRIVSGITPSGDAGLHIGNYLGAVKQFKEMARENECFLFVADLHALTTVQDKAHLERNIETLILHELSLLGDLKHITFFRQSDVPEHTELSVILSNYTPLGLIRRAHAYKDKLQKETAEDDINMGLFCYPILMTSDILLYKPDFVPVGKDQKQHVEITRDIAGRFNHTYKKQVFPLPEALIPEEVAVIYGTDGKRKMSKSLGNIISIFDDIEVIKKQVMSTYTDPSRIHASDKGHIEGNMVFTYLDFFGEKEKVAGLKTAYTEGSVSDTEVKTYLFDTLMQYFHDARERYKELKAHPEEVQIILNQGAQKARDVAQKTIKEVRTVIGLDRMDIKTIPTSEDQEITIEDFAKVTLRVGLVVSAEIVQQSDKLIRLTVQFTSDETRKIFTGVRQYGYSPEYFSGHQFFFVTNLKPRKMLGEESQGMILAVDGEGGKPLFVSASGLPLGSKVR